MELVGSLKEPAGRGRPKGRQASRRIGRRQWVSLHRMLGLVLLLPFTVLAITGAILVLERELFEAAHPRFGTPAKGHAIPSYDAVVEAVKMARPDDPALLFYAQTGPGMPIMVWTRAGDRVAVEAGSGKILEHVRYSEGFLALVEDIHLQFAVPWGGNFVGATALAVLVMGATGLYLWWPRGRNRRVAFRLVWNGPKVAKAYSLHKTIGFYVLVPLVLMSATGALVAFPSLQALLFHRLFGDRPQEPSVRARPEEARQRPLIGADRAMEIARAAAPHARIVRVAVSDGQSAWRVQMRGPVDPYTNGSINVHVHPLTAAVLRVSDPLRERPNRAAAAWIVPIHFGSWAGAWGSSWLETFMRIVWFVMVTGAAVLTTAGGLLWAWRR